MPTNDLEQQLADMKSRLERLEQERQRSRFPRVVVLLAGLVAGTAFSAAVWPANFLPDTPAMAADINDYFNDLKASSVPAGAIVFFGPGTTSCPTGWTAFQGTDGRTIVGTTFGNVGRTVGNPALVDGENRTHGHQWSQLNALNDWYTYSSDGGTEFVIDWQGGLNEGTLSAYFPFTPPAGGVARNYFTERVAANLPYIQLLACRKN